MDERYSECLGWFYRRYPDKIKEYIQSVSPKQLRCKKWLIRKLIEVPKDFENIHLYGGWFGYPIIDYLDKTYKIKNLLNIDFDRTATRTCNRFSEFYFIHNYVKSLCADVSQVSGNFKNIDLVINTSSEHMLNLPELVKNKYYNKSCVFALQSNNMFDIDDHINCVNSKEELIEKSGLNKILYAGTQNMETYSRFMVIGLF